MESFDRYNAAESAKNDSTYIKKRKRKFINIEHNNVGKILGECKKDKISDQRYGNYQK